MAQVIVITGMHRSGTSLVGSLIRAAGAHLGEELLAANVANPHGYFEDVDFYEFHEHLLHERQQSYLYLKPEFTFEPTTIELKRGQQLIAARSMRRLWGWKDPRTSLFLPFWHQLVPHARYLFVYRHPLEVLLSLLRRGEFDNHPSLVVGLETWQLYNARILSFYWQHRDQCLLIHIDGAVGQMEKFADLLQQKLRLDLHLDASTFADIYHAQDLQRMQFPSEVAATLAKLFPGVTELYEQLNTAADIAARGERAPAASHPLAAMTTFSEALPEPVTSAIKHSTLELLLALLAPEPTGIMFRNFYQNTAGAQRSIDYLWLRVQRLERAFGTHGEQDRPLPFKPLNQAS